MKKLCPSKFRGKLEPNIQQTFLSEYGGNSSQRGKSSQSMSEQKCKDSNIVNAEQPTR